MRRADWVCDTAGGADLVGDLVDGIEEEEELATRTSIFESAELAGGEEFEVESLFDEVLNLGSSEAVGTISSACDAAEGF